MGATPAHLLDAFEQAVRDHVAARRQAKDALRRQASLLREIRARGGSTSIAALRAAKVLGLAPNESRQRIAAMLRQRTKRHGIVAPPTGEQPGVTVPSRLGGKESTMPGRLIKRVTEEFIEDAPEPEETELEEADEAPEEDEAAEEDEPKKRRRS